MTQMTADATQKKRRSSRKNTITVRWLISNLGVVFLVLLIVELSVIYTLQFGGAVSYHEDFFCDNGTDSLFTGYRLEFFGRPAKYV